MCNLNEFFQNLDYVQKMFEEGTSTPACESFQELRQQIYGDMFQLFLQFSTHIEGVIRSANKPVTVKVRVCVCVCVCVCVWMGGCVYI